MIDIDIKVYMDFGNAILDALSAEILDAEGNAILDASFNDVSLDVLTNIAWKVGNSGRTVFDRVPDIGSATFRLKNSTTNSAGTIGYYSPDHASVRSQFGLDSVVRIALVENGNEHPQFEGRISRIEPAMGIYRERDTKIYCEDWLAEAARDTIRGITVQTSKRDDQIITLLLALSSHQPTSTDFSVGDDTYTYALHDEHSDTSSLMRVFQKLMMSGFGKMYIQDYNTLVYRSRSDLLLSGTPDAILDNTMSDMKVTRDKKQRVQEIITTAYPSQTDATSVVLWASQREIVIPAGQSVSFDVRFRDPSGRATRVSALSLEAATAVTDFKMSSISGSGTDLNANFVATYDLKADMATVTLSNTSASTGYVWFYQIRGKAVYLYEPLSSTVATGQPDGETLRVDMVYQDDPYVSADIATMLYYWYLTDTSDVEDVMFYANKSQLLTDYAMLPCGSLVTVTEEQTGIDNNFFINGIQKEYQRGKQLKVTWNLVQANQISGVCRLDVVGLAELDSTAVLGA